MRYDNRTNQRSERCDEQYGCDEKLQRNEVGSQPAGQTFQYTTHHLDVFTARIHHRRLSPLQPIHHRLSLIEVIARDRKNNCQMQV